MLFHIGIDLLRAHSLQACMGTWHLQKHLRNPCQSCSQGINMTRREGRKHCRRCSPRRGPQKMHLLSPSAHTAGFPAVPDHKSVPDSTMTSKRVGTDLNDLPSLAFCHMLWWFQEADLWREPFKGVIIVCEGVPCQHQPSPFQLLGFFLLIDLHMKSISRVIKCMPCCRLHGTWPPYSPKL